MKSTGFWVKRFLWMTGMSTMLLLGVELLKGHALEDSLSFAFLWGLIASTLFTGSRYYNARKGVACALCKDTVED